MKIEKNKKIGKSYELPEEVQNNIEYLLDPRQESLKECPIGEIAELIGESLNKRNILPYKAINFVKQGGENEESLIKQGIIKMLEEDLENTHPPEEKSLKISPEQNKKQFIQEIIDLLIGINPNKELLSEKLNQINQNYINNGGDKEGLEELIYKYDWSNDLDQAGISSISNEQNRLVDILDRRFLVLFEESLFGYFEQTLSKNPKAIFLEIPEVLKIDREVNKIQELDMELLKNILATAKSTNNPSIIGDIIGYLVENTGLKELNEATKHGIITIFASNISGENRDRIISEINEQANDLSNQRIKELLQKIIINLWEQAVPPEEIAVETDMEFIRERIMKLIKEGGRTNNQAARETFEKWSGRLSPRQKKLANERLSASENFPFDSIEAGLAFFADLAKKISQTTSSQQNPSKRASKKKKSKKSGRKRK